MKNFESALQIECVKWFDYSYPKLRMNLFSVPNEGARTPANGARMKLQGRRAGVADMILAVPSRFTTSFDFLNNNYHGIFIEFKWGKNKQSKSQKDFEKAVEEQGYLYVLIYDFDSFQTLINGYLK